MIYNANSKMRPPNWRWEQAKKVVDGVSRVRRNEDPIVARIVKYLKEERKHQKKSMVSSKEEAAKAEDAEMSLFKAFPHIFIAEGIHRAEGICRWVVEALVLAQSTSDQIAMDFGGEKDDVEAYEALFFDVRDRLNCPIFLADALFAKAYTRQFDESDCDTFWKILGNSLGANAIQSIITFRSDPSVQRQLRDLAVQLSDLDTVKAVMIQPLNNFTIPEIVGNSPMMKELAGQLQETGSTDDTAMAKLLGAIQFSLKGVDLAHPDSQDFASSGGVKRLSGSETSVKSKKAESNEKEYINEKSARAS